MRQFFLDVSAAETLVAGQTAVLDSEESHHLATVLRGGREQILNLTDGRGRRFTARAIGSGRRIEVEILSIQEDRDEARPPLLSLACAVVKGKRFEWALEKAVEMGAHRIVPLVTEHGVIEPGKGRLQRWTGVLRAALKQSGRCRLPDLEEPLALADHLARPFDGLRLFGAVPDEVPDRGSWTAWLGQAPQPLPPFLEILIGPEGGWTAGEIARLAGAGSRPVDLGPHVLRTETAAVAGLAVLQALRTDWLGRAAAGGGAPDAGS